MKVRADIMFQLDDLDREIYYRLTCFYFVLRDISIAEEWKGTRPYPRNFSHNSSSQSVPLLFTDDSIIFSSGHITRMWCHDENYEWLWEGIRTININKLAVVFSSNILNQTKESIMFSLGISKLSMKDQYLGLPIMVGKAKRKEF